MEGNGKFYDSIEGVFGWLDFIVQMDALAYSRFLFNNLITSNQLLFTNSYINDVQDCPHFFV